MKNKEVDTKVCANVSVRWTMANFIGHGFPIAQPRDGTIMVPYDSLKLRFRQTPIKDLVSTALEHNLRSLKKKGWVWLWFVTSVRVWYHAFVLVFFGKTHVKVLYPVGTMLLFLERPIRMVNMTISISIYISNFWSSCVAIFHLRLPMAFLSPSLYDMPGLAAHVDV